MDELAREDDVVDVDDEAAAVAVAAQAVVAATAPNVYEEAIKLDNDATKLESRAFGFRLAAKRKRARAMELRRSEAWPKTISPFIIIPSALGTKGSTLFSARDALQIQLDEIKRDLRAIDLERANHIIKLIGEPPVEPPESANAAPEIRRQLRTEHVQDTVLWLNSSIMKLVEVLNREKLVRDASKVEPLVWLDVLDTI